MKKNQYRIVRDDFAGYEVQIKRWWFPIWLQASRSGGCGINTNSTIDQAELLANEIAERKTKKEFKLSYVVKNLGELP